MNQNKLGTLAIAGAAITFALMINTFTPLDADLGWLLSFGRDAVFQGKLIRTNIQSFTEPNHPVLMHEWGTAVLWYLSFKLSGSAGLIVFKWTLIFASIAGICSLVFRVDIIK